MKEQMITRAVKLNEILERRGLPCRVVYNKISIVNGKDKDAYSFESSDYNMLPILYFNKAWWAFSDAELADYMGLLFVRNARKVNIRKYQSKEYILSHVRPVLVSKENIPMLEKEDIVYMYYLDMVVVFELILKENVEGTSAVKLKKWNLENASEKISVEELFLAAQKYVSDNYEVSRMDEVLMSYGEERYAEEAVSSTYIVTTQNHIKGAAVMISPVVIDTLMERMDTEKIILLPASIHEMIAVPFDESKIKYLREIVKTMNETIVNTEDKLTDTVYIVSDGVISIA